MATKDDRRAAFILLGLATAGLLIRLLALSSSTAPGDVRFRGVEPQRPARDSLAAQAGRLVQPLRPGERVDVDRAPAVELTRLPRIGPGLAARIVADRAEKGPFGSLEGLDRVPGVGPTVLEAVAAHVAFSDRPRREPAAGKPVRLSTASVKELTQLPGIGPSKAAAIVEDRRKNGPYRTVESLMRVPGIGAVTVDRIRKLVRP
jgi:competence ComEA-like helix-hairpin-helix protein